MKHRENLNKRACANCFRGKLSGLRFWMETCFCVCVCKRRRIYILRCIGLPDALGFACIQVYRPALKLKLKRYRGRKASCVCATVFGIDFFALEIHTASATWTHLIMKKKSCNRAYAIKSKVGKLLYGIQISSLFVCLFPLEFQITNLTLESPYGLSENSRSYKRKKANHISIPNSNLSSETFLHFQGV